MGARRLAMIIAAASGAAIVNGILDAPMDARMPRLSVRVEAMNKVGGQGTLALSLGLKRRPPYGTIPGGIPGALPVLIGYSAVAGRLGADGIMLFLVMLLWQPPHFWALALAHMEEYRDAGVPVLPVALGEPYTKILIFLYAVSLLPTTIALWAFGYCSGGFALISLLLFFFFFFFFYRNVVGRRRYRRAFGASIFYILGILLAVIVDVSARP